MQDMLSKTKMIRNFSRRITIDSSNESFIIETDLFPIEALDVYSAYNLGDSIQDEDCDKYFSASRGGSQGDYRTGMVNKIANVVDCLLRFPNSKRAVITIPNNPSPSHISDDDAKCMREIHFYLDIADGRQTLNATVWMRAQAAEIFPKNIHFIGRLMERVADGLNEGSIDKSKKVVTGELFYLATTLVSVRED